MKELKNWKYFKIEEFRCPCCGTNLIHTELVDKLDEAREKAGIPFKITSGYRCPKHNAAIGGVENSAHIKGLAADILCTNSDTRFKIIKALLEVGFRRIGIGEHHIHVDIDITKPMDVIFLEF